MSATTKVTCCPKSVTSVPKGTTAKARSAGTIETIGARG